jgi:hypothetical protein
MTKNTDAKSKVFQALEALVPEGDRAKLTEAVSEFLDGARAELETEYNANLESAYKTVEAEKLEAEKVALKGYNEAYEIIVDFKNRLETQREEFEVQLEEAHEQAKDLILAERKKNEELELTINEAKERELHAVKTDLVDKIDQFLSVKEEELHEMAKAQILNDPYMLEHKLAWDKVLNLASDWLSDEDYASVTASKAEELGRQVTEAKQQVKVLEARANRLTAERDKLNEQVRASAQVISEGTEKVRSEKKKTVEGKGVVVNDKSRQEVVVLKEAVATEEPTRIDEDTTSIEAQWRKLAYDNK